MISKNGSETMHPVHSNILLHHVNLIPFTVLDEISVSNAVMPHGYFLWNNSVNTINRWECKYKSASA